MLDDLNDTMLTDNTESKPDYYNKKNKKTNKIAQNVYDWSNDKSDKVYRTVID